LNFTLEPNWLKNNMTAAEIKDIDRRLTSLETEVHIQFKEVFTRVKRLEAIMIGTSGTIIVLLLKVAFGS